METIDFRYWLQAVWRIIDWEVLENLSIFHLIHFYIPEAYSGLYQPSKTEPFAKMKPGNYFCKILHIRYLTGFWMRLLFSVHIWEFECPPVCFKDWVFLTHFKPPFHSYWKQIDWFRHEKECCLEWVKKWLKCFEKHMVKFFF